MKWREKVRWSAVAAFAGVALYVFGKMLWDYRSHLDGWVFLFAGIAGGFFLYPACLLVLRRYRHLLGFVVFLLSLVVFLILTSLSSWVGFDEWSGKWIDRSIAPGSSPADDWIAIPILNIGLLMVFLPVWAAVFFYHYTFLRASDWLGLEKPSPTAPTPIKSPTDPPTPPPGG